MDLAETWKPSCAMLFTTVSEMIFYAQNDKSLGGPPAEASDRLRPRGRRLLLGFRSSWWPQWGGCVLACGVRHLAEHNCRLSVALQSAPPERDVAEAATWT
jgi:hypothetical protein